MALVSAERIVRRTIKLKKLVLDKAGDMFKFQKFIKLYTPVDWAACKLISFNREELAKGMLKWSKDPFHQSLLELVGPDGKPLLAPDMKTKYSSMACRMFKNVLGYMGDRKINYPETLATEIMSICLANPPLRDEMYLQLCKQLSNNPDNESKRKGWNLMQLFLDTFPPSEEFENYIEYASFSLFFSLLLSSSLLFFLFVPSLFLSLLSILLPWTRR